MAATDREYVPDAAASRSRRRWVVAGIAAAALAVLAVPLVISMGSGPVGSAVPGDVPEPTHSSPVSSAPALPERDVVEVCAEARDEAATYGWAPAGEKPRLREGAVRAWLCGDDTPDGDALLGGTRGPLDPLTERVEEAVDWYLSADLAPAEQACTAEYRLTYTVAFEYSDGSLIPVRGEPHGCRTVTDGDTTKLGGEEYLGLLKGLWSEARTPGFTARPELCSAAASIIEADPAQSVAGARCTADQNGVVTKEAMSEELARAVGESVATSAEPADPLAVEYPERVWVLELMDRAGDIFRLELLADGSFVHYDGEQPMVWDPPADLDEALSLLGES